MTTPTTELTAAVAASAAAFGADGPDAAVAAMVKRFVLDTIGTTLAAGTLGAGCPQIVRLASDGAVGPSTVIGFGTRTSAPLAALANGAMAHALNFDDASEIHLGVTTIPAALAVAERRGGVSGRDLIAAVAAGMELMARLGRCLSAADFPDEGHPQPTQMPGYFAAAVSAGRILGLDAAGLHSAFGVALLQCAGARQNLLDGRHAKAVYAGFAAQGGVQAALLAADGLDAACHAFEGAGGLFGTYYRDGVDPTALAGSWAEPLLLASSFKQWPTTAAGHPQLRAALRLRAEGTAESSLIESVLLTGHRRAVTFAEPADRKQAPATSVEAEDSVFFPVAKALLGGTVTLADIHGPGLHDPGAVALARRMSFRVDPTHGRNDGAVEIRLTNGRVLRAEHRAADTVPMDEAAALDKFLDCAAHARHPMSPERARAVAGLVARLDELDDITTLIDALAPERPAPDALGPEGAAA